MSSFPRHIAPMLATPGECFDSPEFCFEVKWDGIRALAYRDEDQLTLETRNFKALLPRFPELMQIKGELRAPRLVLDGEVVVFGSTGKPNFDIARSRNAQRKAAAIAAASTQYPAVYVAFDCLFADGKSLIDLPLLERHALLEQAVDPQVRLSLSRGVVEHGLAYFAAVADKGLEGIVAKRLSSRYRPGKRSPDWIKVRNVSSVDCVIGGFIPKEQRMFKSLVLGVYPESGGRLLHYIGHVGTGFTTAQNRALRARLAGRRRERSPFGAQPPECKDALWVKPDIVCTVEYLTLTANGHLRHPTFRGVREDKLPGECAIDQVLNL